MGFRKDFIWGAATASYQIEGAAFEGGKGPSVWDTFSHWPGKIYGGHTGDIACDHYHRVEEDVKLMARLGVKNYRFSLSWPRILPQGVGAVNEEGVAFYNRLIDALLANGIRPFVTLFHWDYPQALAERGAWANPDSPKWFEAYVSVCARRFGNRVKAFHHAQRAAVLHRSGLWHGRSRAGTDAPRRRDHPDEPSCAQGARSGGSRPAFARSGLPRGLCAVRRRGHSVHLCSC